MYFDLTPEVRVNYLRHYTVHRLVPFTLARASNIPVLSRKFYSKHSCTGFRFDLPSLESHSQYRSLAFARYPGPESAQYFVSLAEGALAGMPSRAGDSATEEVAGAACGDWGGMPHNGSVSGDTQHAGNGYGASLCHRGEC